jgi:hypothetical protein
MTTLTLECWIVGDTLTERFLVQVDSNKLVKDLKQAIKEERDDVLSDIKAVNIMLWGVCESCHHDAHLAHLYRFPY